VGAANVAEIRNLYALAIINHFRNKNKNFCRSLPAEGGGARCSACAWLVSGLMFDIYDTDTPLI
jgi:hypothetical protein